MTHLKENFREKVVADIQDFGKGGGGEGYV